MAYINGNLALERKSEQRPNPKQARQETRAAAPARKSGLSRQNKLLYLFAIIVGVAVALTVLYRYAQIYEMNVELARIENRLKQLEAENVQLKRELDGLKDPARIREKAKEWGLVQPSDSQIAHVTSAGKPGEAQKAEAKR